MKYIIKETGYILESMDGVLESGNGHNFTEAEVEALGLTLLPFYEIEYPKELSIEFPHHMEIASQAEHLYGDLENTWAIGFLEGVNWIKSYLLERYSK